MSDNLTPDEIQRLEYIKRNELVRRDASELSPFPSNLLYKGTCAHAEDFRVQPGFILQRIRQATDETIETIDKVLATLEQEQRDRARRRYVFRVIKMSLGSLVFIVLAAYLAFLLLI